MAKAPSPTVTSREYTFNSQCKSGATKSTTFTAANYNEARTKLREFIDNN